MYERFTDRARKVIEYAMKEAHDLGHGWVGTEHLLLGCALEEQGLARQVLGTFQLSPEFLRSVVLELLEQSPAAANTQPSLQGYTATLLVDQKWGVAIQSIQK